MDFTENDKIKKRQVKFMKRSYTVEFRQEAVKLAKELGQVEAARQLKMPKDTLIMWVNKERKGELPSKITTLNQSDWRSGTEEKTKKLEQEIKMLKSEMVQIREENQILEGAATFFAARQKKWVKN